MSEAKQVCVECLMDTDDPKISFDDHGVCNYCRIWRSHKDRYGCIEHPLDVWKNQKLPMIINSGVSKKFNCIVGVSGGIDSSYLCYRLKDYKELRPLLVHVSGVFDTEVSKRNLNRIVKNTEFNIVYPTVDLEDYLSVQKAYLLASVLDTDVPADYLIEAFIRIVAKKYGIKFVLSGGNYMADAFMPYSWTYANKLDLTNLLAINKMYGDSKLKSFPKFSSLDELWTRRIYGLRYKTPLNYFSYSRFTALDELKNAWGYEAYGDKHDENIFTRFYQKYILPTKFHIDKRKANYSNYIRAGVWSRDQALVELAKPFYNNEQFLSDWKTIMDVLGWSNSYFASVLALPPHRHEEFPTSEWVYNLESYVSKKINYVRGLFSVFH